MTEHRSGKNEYRGFSPIQLQEEFLRAYELMPEMKDGLDPSMLMEGDTLLKLLNRADTFLYRNLLHKVDAMIKHMPVSWYYQGVLRTKMKLRTQIGVAPITGGIETSFLLGVTHRPVIDDQGFVCAIYTDPNGGAFNKEQSYEFESRAYRYEISRIQEDSERMRIPIEGQFYMMQEAIRWRESGRHYHGKLL